MLIYFISGIGGYVISGIFIINQVTTGADPAVFGLLAVLLVELFQSWQVIPPFLLLSIIKKLDKYHMIFNSRFLLKKETSRSYFLISFVYTPAPHSADCPQGGLGALEAGWVLRGATNDRHTALF
jgi:hypothetical protein